MDDALFVPNDIWRTFREEFGPVAHLFEIHEPDREHWQDHKDSVAARPGVYVWLDGNPGRVVKVGLSLVNARARALQHIRDNTGGIMKALGEEGASVQLVLLTTDSTHDHWAVALERYLETALDPTIRSKR